MRESAILSESQWTVVDYCIHCNCPIYEMDGEIKFTGEDCGCEREEPQEDRDEMET